MKFYRFNYNIDHRIGGYTIEDILKEIEIDEWVEQNLSPIRYEGTIAYRAEDMEMLSLRFGSLVNVYLYHEIL